MLTIEDAVKDDPELNQQLLKASEAYHDSTSQLPALMDLLKAANFSELHTSVSSMKNSVSSMKKNMETMAQSSSSIAWSLGSRMSAIESTQAAVDEKINTIQADTSAMKSMMAELLHAFKSQGLLLLQCHHQLLLSLCIKQ